MVRFIFKNLALILSRIIYRIKIIGKENIPKDTAAILCPNHVNCIDAIVFVSNTKRKVYILAKEEMFRHKFNNWFWRKLCLLPVKRESADLEAIKTSLKLLKENKLFLIFPEGTRKGLAKGVKPKNGAVILSARSGAPIIPVGIKGTFRPFSKLTITIGKPIDYSEYKKQTGDKELITNLTNNLMEKIVELAK